jgi:outer membrane protein assembly factor BamB
MMRLTIPGASVMAAISGLAVSSIPGPAQAQEWTRFRGPNGSGIASASSLPIRVTPADYLWRTELPGAGHSSPVLWGERLFITSAEDDRGKRHVHCLDAKTGKILWSRSDSFQKHPMHQHNTTASATPTVDATRVYAAWPAPESYLVIALDHSGKELWRRDLGRLVTDWGGGASPVVAGGVVMLGVYQEQEGAAGFLVGLDKNTGAIRWKVPRQAHNSSAYSSPLIYQPEGGKAEAIFTSTAHGMTSVDPETGTVNWEAPGLFKQRCVASPIQAGHLIFATAGSGGGAREAVAVRPGSAPSKTEPKVAYRLARGPSYVPSPIAWGDRIYAWGDGGIVTCLKAGTGEPVWNERVGGDFFSSPICAAGKLYAVSTRGELVVLETGDQFKVLGRSDLGEASHATPAVANGRMFVRTLSHVICIGKG